MAVSTQTRKKRRILTDPIINAILQGLFTGIGIVIANWIGQKYITPRLEKTHTKLFHPRK